MKIKRTSTCLLMVSGMLLFIGGALQAQVGGGSSLGGSGGAVGQGSPDITRPGTGGDATRGGAGTPQGSSGSMKPGHESSGTMGSEGAIIKPGPGGGLREDQGDYPVQAQRILVRAAEADPPREAALAAWVHRGAWGHPVGPDREAGWDHQAAREAADNRRVVIKSMRGSASSSSLTYPTPSTSADASDLCNETCVMV